MRIDFTDIKSIIDKQWYNKPEDASDIITFEKEFSIQLSPEDPFKTKKDRTKWLTDLNFYRDSWTKVKGKALNRSQVEMLRTILLSLRAD